MFLETWGIRRITNTNPSIYRSQLEERAVDGGAWDMEVRQYKLGI